MSRSVCSRCRARWAQTFGSPLCRQCVTGRPAPARYDEDDPRAIEAKYQAALRDIRARSRLRPAESADR
jgi:hypothetical protein